MKNKIKPLILEILLIQERYSLEDINRALEELKGQLVSREIVDLIERINSLSFNSKQGRDLKTKSVRPTISKNALISRLRQGSHSVKYHLVTELSKKMKIGEEFGGSRPTVEFIIDSVKSMSTMEYNKIMEYSDQNQNVDRNFMDLANFILKEK